MNGQDTTYWFVDSGSLIIHPTLQPQQVVLFYVDNWVDPVSGYHLGNGYAIKALGTNTLRFLPPHEISRVEFADGTVWSYPQFALLSKTYSQAMPGQTFVGGSWNADYLQGAAGSETLVGNDGNDVLDGGAGNDVLDGSSGSDTYVLRTGGGSDMVFDWANFGETNRIVVAPGFGPEQVALFWMQSGTDPVTGEFHPSSYVLRLLGSNDEIRFQQDAIQEVLFSNGTVWSSAQFPQLMRQFQPAMPGQGWLNGSSQADYLQGNSTNEHIYAGAGDDVLDGGAGNDVLDGSSGSDTYVLRTGGGSDRIFDWANFGETNRIVVAPGIGTDQVELYTQEFLTDPITGQTLFEPLITLRLVGTRDMLWFSMNSIQSIEFSDGTKWGHEVIQAATPRPNNSPIGEIRIQGEVEAGQTLSAVHSLSDADGLGALQYQWRSNGITIEGATSGQYTLTSVDIGKSISVELWYLDGYDTRESVTSAPTTAVTPTNISWGGGSYSETFTGSLGNDTLFGMGGNDTLFGRDGNDVLIGGVGVDRLEGGEGSDLYVVFLASEHTAAEFMDYGVIGVDEVRFASTTSSTLTLYAGDIGLERVVIGTGLDAVANSSSTVSLHVNASAVGNGLMLVGNAGANRLTGTAFADTLDGGLGIDTMAGGAGNDIYWVNHVSDVVSEASGAGIDTVMSSVSLTLVANVEHLTLLGNAALNGNGNSLSNQLTGNAGNNILMGLGGNDVLNGGAGADTLDGGVGSDTLVGGTGNDVFRFANTLGATNVDTIVDFAFGDRIQLENAIFTRLASTGTLSSAFFAANSTGRAMDSNDYVIYNTTTGALSYDRDGSGTGAAVQFATLVGAPTVTAADFQIT